VETGFVTGGERSGARLVDQFPFDRRACRINMGIIAEHFRELALEATDFSSDVILNSPYF
jgi:hypothetical protein